MRTTYLNLESGSMIETDEDNGEGVRLISSNVPVVFTMKGNCTDRDHNFLSTEVLYKAWKDYIGKEVDSFDGQKRIVSEVSMSIFKDCIYITTIQSS